MHLRQVLCPLAGFPALAAVRGFQYWEHDLLMRTRLPLHRGAINLVLSPSDVPRLSSKCCTEHPGPNTLPHPLVPSDDFLEITWLSQHMPFFKLWYLTWKMCFQERWNQSHKFPSSPWACLPSSTSPVLKAQVDVRMCTQAATRAAIPSAFSWLPMRERHLLLFRRYLHFFLYEMSIIGLFWNTRPFLADWGQFLFN